MVEWDTQRPGGYPSETGEPVGSPKTSSGQVTRRLFPFAASRCAKDPPEMRTTSSEMDKEPPKSWFDRSRFARGKQGDRTSRAPRVDRPSQSDQYEAFDMSSPNVETIVDSNPSKINPRKVGSVSDLTNLWRGKVSSPSLPNKQTSEFLQHELDGDAKSNSKHGLELSDPNSSTRAWSSLHGSQRRLLPGTAPEANGDSQPQSRVSNGATRPECRQSGTEVSGPPSADLADARIPKDPPKRCISQHRSSLDIPKRYGTEMPTNTVLKRAEVDIHENPESVAVHRKILEGGAPRVSMLRDLLSPRLKNSMDCPGDSSSSRGSVKSDGMTATPGSSRTRRTSIADNWSPSSERRLSLILLSSIQVKMDKASMAPEPVKYPCYGKSWFRDLLLSLHNPLRREIEDIFGMLQIMASRVETTGTVPSGMLRGMFAWWGTFEGIVDCILLAGENIVFRRVETVVSFDGRLSKDARARARQMIMGGLRAISRQSSTMNDKQFLARSSNDIHVAVSELLDTLCLVEETVPNQAEMFFTESTREDLYSELRNFFNHDSRHSAVYPTIVRWMATLPKEVFAEWQELALSTPIRFQLPIWNAEMNRNHFRYVDKFSNF
mmetsp:Transcript_8072/g.16255  ORF Transcript_8072/g.16255 Transcript_8072/m.16255 type:complete len:607 (-) Transcript_8072:966-2786(-)